MKQYTIFWFVYFFASQVMGALISELFVELANWQLLIPFIAAPIAILAARRFGPLSKAGVLATSILVVFLTYVFTWLILRFSWISEHHPLPFTFLARQLGWFFATSVVLGVMAPFLWMIFVGNNRRLEQGH